MKKLLFIIFITHSSLLISHCQPGWYPLVSGTTLGLNSVYFPATGTGNLGYAVGGLGKILFTANAGVNWVSQTSPSGNDFYSVFFISPSTGWAAGTLGMIIFTSNSGLSWLQQTTPTTETLYSIYFVSQLTGWCAGHGGVILYTSDGGANWTTQNSGNGEYLRSVYFTGPSNGTAVGRNGRIIKTTNGGSNWFDVSPFLTSTLYSVYFATPSVGWAVGFGSLYTTNGGYNWSLQQGSTGIYFSVYFLTVTTGWKVGYPGIINVTTNAGATWIPQTSSVTDWLYSVYFTSVNTGYVVGNNGIILKTTDGGGLFTGITPIGNAAQKFYLYQNYPNPFNPSTKIKFEIPQLNPLLRGVPLGLGVFVKLTIYDILGKKAATLVNEELRPGAYQVEWNASNSPSGIYFYKLISGDFSQTNKMVLMK